LRGREAVLKLDVALNRKQLNAQIEIVLSRTRGKHGRNFICRFGERHAFNVAPDMHRSSEKSRRFVIGLVTGAFELLKNLRSLSPIVKPSKTFSLV
jgi:hypothetical protein